MLGDVLDEKGMKNILIISPNSKHFVREYIENVLSSQDYDVTFYTIAKNKMDSGYYNEHSIKCISVKKGSDESLMGNFFHVLSSWIWLKKNKNNFDIIHVHFMDSRFLKFCRTLLRSNAKLVITFWGSDLLVNAAGDTSVVQCFCPWLDKAHAINLMEQNSAKVFNKLFPTVDTKKVKIIDFGDSLLSLIKKEDKRIGRDKAKEKYSLPLNKLVVHIGHNGSAAHQHLQLLRSIGKIAPHIKEKLYVVMHFGYGTGGNGYSRKEYIDAVKNAANSTAIEYKLLTEYLTGDDLADFRLTADVMLYGQMTDAISSSVVETVYAGGLFINPTWLDYSEFRDAGIKFIEYNTFDEIPEIITKIVNEGALTEREIAKNKKAIWVNKSWSVLADKWRKMYD